MPDRMDFLIQCEEDRERICRMVRAVSEGTAITFTHPDTRTAAQNRRMWALLRRLSEEIEWHGAHYRPSEWKGYFLAELSGDVFMPRESGGYVSVSRSSGHLSAKDFEKLTGLILAFAQRQGIDL